MRPDNTLPSKTLAIDDERAPIQLLSAFGLGEKEAQLYVHLLKYGPKRAGDLARSLKTYREDVYRRCARLVHDGMAAKSTEDSSSYSPVELDEVLDAALDAHKHELRRLQRVKQKLVEDASGALGRAHDACVFKMLKTVGEVVTAISQLINSAETSIIFVAHPRFNLISMGGFLDHQRCAVERDVIVRGVLDISPRNLSAARDYLGCGVELRHADQYRGMTTVVADGRRSFSLIYSDKKTALSLDENVAALWSDSIAQAEFLTSAFEMAWEQANGAEERIDQLLQSERPSLGPLQPPTRSSP